MRIRVVAAVTLLALANAAVSEPTKKVAVQDVVAMYVERIAAESDNGYLMYKLALLHTTAFAAKIDSIDVIDLPSARADGLPVYRYLPISFPYQTIIPTDDPVTNKRALEHLSRARHWYERAVSGETEPFGLFAFQAYGWVLEQYGLREEAKTAYRKAIERGFALLEQGPVVRPWADRRIVKKASQRLLRLLDEDGEKQEYEERLKELGRIESKFPLGYWN